MNELLSTEFTRDEVESALKKMEPLKALEPNKLPLLFFQKYWPNMGDEISLAVLSCLNSGSIPPSINHTFITLIPKVKSPTKVSEYRPISLWNILYKLVSKVVANKFKNFLPHYFWVTKCNLVRQSYFWQHLSSFWNFAPYKKKKKKKKEGFMTQAGYEQSFW